MRMEVNQKSSRRETRSTKSAFSSKKEPTHEGSAKTDQFNIKNEALDANTDSMLKEETNLKTTGPTRIQRVKMEAFIKVKGCRKVTIEVLSADGEVISTDVQEVDDEPEVLKISSQEKMTYGDPSTFQVQKPETFILPYEFLKKTNFSTSVSVKCPRFSNGNSDDPVFCTLNTISKPEDNCHPDIQNIKTNVTLQMKDWKISHEPKNRPPKKAKVISANSKLPNPSQESMPAENDDVVIIGVRGSKRVRKPTKKMLEYQELEKAELKEGDKKAKKIFDIKKEPGTEEETTKNFNSNHTVTTTSNLKDKSFHLKKGEVPHESKVNPESGVVCKNVEAVEQKSEELDGKILTSKEVNELLNISSWMNIETDDQTDVQRDHSEVKIDNSDVTVNDSDVKEDNSDSKDIKSDFKNETEGTDNDTSEDYSIFDDEVYEKKYGSKFQPTQKCLPCRFCSFVFTSRVSLNKHMKKHRIALNILKDQCDVCKKTFSNRYVFECHQLIHTHETEDGKYKCSLCNKIFNSRSGLLKHLRSGKDCQGTDFKCEFCGVMYNSLQTLDIHRRRVHVGAFPDKKETCKNCGKTFETKGGLGKHIRNKACEVLFTCETCGKTFNNESRFKKHNQTHVESLKPSTVCETCGKKLSTAAALAVHKNSHLNIRNYECKICKKTFLQKGTLVAHERIHTGERPYLCNTCGASFRYNSHLSQHENLHTGKIKYPCTKPKCGRTFLTRHSLKKHLISHDRRERISELKQPASLEIAEVKPESMEASDVVVAEDEIIYLNEVVGEEDENTQYRYIYTTEDGQHFLTNSADTIVASDQHIEYQDGQNIVYQTVEGDNVTFVDEMQTSDLNILAETAQNYENSGVTYVIVKK